MSISLQSMDAHSAASKGETPIHAVVDGWTINVGSQAQAIEETIALARRGEGFTLFTLNMDLLVKLRQFANFRRAFSSARLVTADGAPVVYFASRQDPRVGKTTGSDLVLPLAVAATEAKLPVYLFGTSEQVLDDVTRFLAQRTNGAIDIVGHESPEKNFDPEGPSADAAIERIRQSGARLCFVALGAPKQELLSARAIEKGVAAGFVCIGGSLDFLVGAQVRAPKVMQDWGIEWVWRLLNNPRRLGMRYLRCAMLAIELAVTGATGRARPPRAALDGQ